MKHTPSPWEANYHLPRFSGDGRWAVEMTTSATVIALIESEDFSEAEANARLIAAAPELYKCLKKVQRELSFPYNYSRTSQFSTIFRDRINAVITAAEGGTNDKD